ncbi:MAG: 50S ribosomal protein L3 [Myxococcaceae bacterium]|nr:50S ribosomal protein L3 [Myxococcaceae bacterium]
MKGLIGKKVGMTQVFDGDGNMVPVTIIDVNSCIVVGKRTAEKDKYTAVTLGFGEAKEKKLNKPEAGHVKKSGSAPRKFIKEFRISGDDLAKYNVGDAVKPDMFAKGELVDVSGITKGRGTQGVVKRWKFRGFGQTHGTHEYRKHPGAVGQRKTPGRVYPNKKMPGHYGVEAVTTQNLTVVDVLADKGLLLVKGGIAGHNDGVVIVKPSIKLAMRTAHKAKKK